MHAPVDGPGLAGDLRKFHAEGLEPFDVFGDVLDVGVDERGIGEVLRDFHHVGAEGLLRFVVPLGLLLRRVAGGDAARGVEGVACGAFHFFEHHDVEAERAGFDRADETADAGPEDHHVVYAALGGFGIGCRTGGSGERRARAKGDGRTKEISSRKHGFTPC